MLFLCFNIPVNSTKTTTSPISYSVNSTTDSACHILDYVSVICFFLLLSLLWRVKYVLRSIFPASMHYIPPICKPEGKKIRLIDTMLIIRCVWNPKCQKCHRGRGIYPFGRSNTSGQVMHKKIPILLLTLCWRCINNHMTDYWC